MNDVFMVSLRALARGRRLLVVALLLVVPALLSLAEAASTQQEEIRHFVIDLFSNLQVPVLMPLVALIFATTALGSEIEDRTLLYLTLRPVSRLSIVLAKWLAAILITVVLVEASIILSYLIAAHSILDGRTLAALLLAGLGGCLAYSSLFLLLGLLMPRRALIVGFIYVLIWEGIAAGLSTALATLSIRRYVDGALHAALSDADLVKYTQIDIGGLASTLVLAAVVVAGLSLSNWGLQRLELP
jgi:ABC-2 type transport system permease protein